MPKLERVIDFMVKVTGGPLLGIYAALAELEYPIDDKASLQEAIGGRISDESLAAEVGVLFEQVLTLEDFPLASVQNALEKFNLRLPPRARIVPVPRHLAPPAELVDFPDVEPPAAVDRLQVLFYTKGGVLGWYFRRLECQRRCDAQYERCSAHARHSPPGDDTRAAARCAGELYMCTDACG
jgi:hypothetical protein